MRFKNKVLVLLTISALVPTFAIAAPAPAAPAAAEAPAATSKARIKFDATEFDFGTVEQGEKVTHIYNFVNVGSEPLLIDRVQTSCGCTAAVTSSKTVQPKEKGTIETTFNSARFNGQINKTISVYTNDSEEPMVRLTLLGKVSTEVMIVPHNELFFGMVDYQKTSSKSFLLTQEGSTPLEVLKVECDLPFVTTEILAGTAGDKKTYQVMVNVGDKAPLGRFEGAIKIYTNIQKYAVVERKVIGVVKKADEVVSGDNKTAPMPPSVEPISKPATK